MGVLSTIGKVGGAVKKVAGSSMTRQLAGKATRRLAKTAWDWSGAGEIDALNWVGDGLKKVGGGMAGAAQQRSRSQPVMPVDKAPSPAALAPAPAPSPTPAPSAPPAAAPQQAAKTGRPHTEESKARISEGVRAAREQAKASAQKTAAQISASQNSLKEQRAMTEQLRTSKEGLNLQDRIASDVHFIAEKVRRGDNPLLPKPAAAEGGGALGGLAGLLGNIPGAGGLLGKVLGKVPGLGGVAEGAGKILGKGGGLLGKAAGKSLLKKIPLIGAIAGLGLGANRAFAGDWKGAGLEVASGVAGTFPGIGTAASVGIDGALAARDYAASQEKPLDSLEAAMTDKNEGIFVKPADDVFSPGLSASLAPGLGATPQRPVAPSMPAASPRPAVPVPDLKPSAQRGDVSVAAPGSAPFAPFSPPAGNYADSPLAQMIGAKESKNDYTAYNRTKGGLKSFYNTDLTGMTLGEVMEKQKNREMFAAGRFQVIPDTLKGAAEKLKLDPTAKFDKAMQDRIFNEYLIAEKRPEIKRFLEGKGSMESAQLAAAKEWASMPVAAGTRLNSGRIAKGGESYYDGDGLNKAGTSLESVQAALNQSRYQALTTPVDVAKTNVTPPKVTAAAQGARDLRASQPPATPPQPIVVAAGGASQGTPHRPSAAAGDAKPPIVVRNNESSLSRVTDNMINRTVS